jgi:hypothetical protein
MFLRLGEAHRKGFLGPFSVNTFRPWVQVVHALSVSLNKLGDLKYYAQDLEAARAFYARALNVRLEATSDFTTLSSQASPFFFPLHFPLTL